MNYKPEGTLVGELTKGVVGHRLFTTLNGNVLVYITSCPTEHRVYTGGIPGPSFESVDNLRASPDAQSIVYSGVIGEKHAVVRNGVISNEYRWVGRFRMSRAGQLAYPAVLSHETEGQYRLIYDGRTSRSFDAIGDVVWDWSGKVVAYSATAGSSELAICGEDVVGTFKRVRGLQFSPDGRLFYWALRGDSWWLYCGKEPFAKSGTAPGQSFHGLGFTRFGQPVFWREEDGKWFLEGTMRRYGPFAGFEEVVGQPVLSGTCDETAYVAKDGNRVRVFRNEVAGSAYDAVGRPVLVGGLLAYKARLGEREYLVVNGQEYGPYEVDWPEEGECASYLEDVPFVSSAGKVGAISKTRTGYAIIVDGKLQVEYLQITGSPCFAGSAEGLVYGGLKDGGEYVIAHDEVIGPFEEVSTPIEPSSGCGWRWQPLLLEGGKVFCFFVVVRGKIYRYVVDFG